MLRRIETSGKRRTFARLLHGTMAGGMPSAFGLQRRTVAICLSAELLFRKRRPIDLSGRIKVFSLSG
jgi:hypothetical protein